VEHTSTRGVYRTFTFLQGKYDTISVDDGSVTQLAETAHSTLATEWTDYLDTRRPRLHPSGVLYGKLGDYKGHAGPFQTHVPGLKNYGSTKHGIIACTPKSDSPSTQADHRTTLLNIDYTTLARTVANRLRPTVSDVLHQGAVPGNTIFDAVAKVHDGIAYAELTHDPHASFLWTTQQLLTGSHTRISVGYYSYRYSTLFIALINAKTKLSHRYKLMVTLQDFSPYDIPSRKLRIQQATFRFGFESVNMVAGTQHNGNNCTQPESSGGGICRCHTYDTTKRQGIRGHPPKKGRRVLV
jgi:hypothetical protein